MIHKDPLLPHPRGGHGGGGFAVFCRAEGLLSEKLIFPLGIRQGEKLITESPTTRPMQNKSRKHPKTFKITVLLWHLLTAQDVTLS